ncbi:hypothetical protein DB778_05620, partial [Xanthomonas perforans]
DHPAPTTPLAQQIAALPPALRGQVRPLGTGNDGKSLTLRQYARPEGVAGNDRWPLPGSAIAATQAASAAH